MAEHHLRAAEWHVGQLRASPPLADRSVVLSEMHCSRLSSKVEPVVVCYRHVEIYFGLDSFGHRDY